MAINTIPRSFQAWPNNYTPNPATAPVSATPAEFNLDAGIYGLEITAGVFGTATLEKLLANGTTWVAMSAAIGAASYTVLTLPAGRYRLTLAGITALVGQIELISRLAAR